MSGNGDDRACIICGRPLDAARAAEAFDPWPVYDHGECCRECHAVYVTYALSVIAGIRSAARADRGEKAGDAPLFG